jgi:pimeloyl-ACP methyl ester carboxylesterase
MRLSSQEVIIMRRSCPSLAALLLTALSLSFVLPASGQAPAPPDLLKRRPSFGARFAPLTGQQREEQKLPADQGVLMPEILPGTTAEAAGLRANDVLLTLDGQAIASPAQVIQWLPKKQTGDPVTLEFARGAERLTKTLTMLERPRERNDAFETLYDSVESMGKRLRVILTKPKEQGKHPALMLIGGLGSFSIDNPFGGNDPYQQIAYEFTRKGYVTMRVDKPGCGDSEGGPWSEIDFQTELDGYRQALKALKARDFVDAENVFVFGHSMGGIMGPLLVAENPVRGIAVYGTVARTWPEYTLENTRRQMELGGEDFASIEEAVKTQTKLLTHLLLEKQTPKEIGEKHPGLKEDLDQMVPDGTHFFGAHLSFFQQLAGINVAESWQKVRAEVLALWGKADFVASQEDHALITRLVNQYKPGRGTFLALDNLDHNMSKAATQAESMQRQGQPGEFNPVIITKLLEWAQTKTARKTS